MKEKDFKLLLKDEYDEDKFGQEILSARIYYAIDEEGNVILDEEEMRNDFEDKLRQLNGELE
jgi:hypothetical protein